MNNRERRRAKSPGFNVGSASMIMVFAVLCLTIFAVLSLVTANSDLRLSRSAAKSIEDYYDAEYHAETKVLEVSEKLKSGYEPSEIDGVEAERRGAETVIRFLQKVDGNRDLSVALKYGADKKLSVSEWKLLPGGDWNPDGGIDVWQGN